MAQQLFSISSKKRAIKFYAYLQHYMGYSPNLDDENALGQRARIWEANHEIWSEIGAHESSFSTKWLSESSFVISKPKLSFLGLFSMNTQIWWLSQLSLYSTLGPYFGSFIGFLAEQLHYDF